MQREKLKRDLGMGKIVPLIAINIWQKVVYSFTKLYKNFAQHGTSPNCPYKIN